MGCKSWRRRRLPRKIIFIRHGEAQHNLEGAAILQEDNPNRKPDNLSELTPLGREQARAAGHRLRRLLGGDGTISAVVSPFERTQQTLYALQQNLGDVRVRRVHVDPRVREQEFGNFQVAEDMPRHKQTAAEVGRFYYRRPTGESGADVYDRAASFWDSLLGGSFNMQDLFRRRRAGPDDALLVVTHGLTMRLLMMRYFNWSPQTFDAVYNPGNCDFWVLVKDEARRAYRLEPADCSPPCMPWATRQVRVVRHAGAGLEAQDYTLVDYLALPQPRTSHLEAALQSLVPGHGHHLNPLAPRPPEEREAFIKEQLAKVEPIEEHGPQHRLVVRQDQRGGSRAAHGQKPPNAPHNQRRRAGSSMQRWLGERVDAMSTVPRNPVTVTPPRAGAFEERQTRRAAASPEDAQGHRCDEGRTEDARARDGGCPPTPTTARNYAARHRSARARDLRHDARADRLAPFPSKNAKRAPSVKPPAR